MSDGGLIVSCGLIAGTFLIFQIFLLYLYQAISTNVVGTGLAQSEGFKPDSGHVTPLLSHIS